MGVWTQVSGTHKSKKVSAKKLVSEILDGGEFRFTNKGDDTFEFIFETDGLSAAKEIDRIVKRFHELDKHGWIELRAEILFY